MLMSFWTRSRLGREPATRLDVDVAPQRPVALSGAACRVARHQLRRCLGKQREAHIRRYIRPPAAPVVDGRQCHLVTLLRALTGYL
jgi:hypothetical protein